MGGFYFLYYGLKFYDIAGNYDLINLSYLGQFVSGLVLSFFTLSTFILIVLAYLNQREEIIHLQKMNLQQDNIIKAQIAKDEYEKFERTFYRLLDWYRSFMNSISYPDVTLNRIYIGRGALNKVLESFNSEFKRNLRLDECSSIAALNKTFNDIFERYDDMEPYFNNLYSVVEFIERYFDAEVIEEDEADKFVSIFSGQLANSELGLLAYYGLYEDSPLELKGIIENYGMLKNLNHSRVVSSIVDLYDTKAFT